MHPRRKVMFFVSLIVCAGMALIYLPCSTPAKTITEQDRAHWAFQTITRPPIPITDSPSTNPIDRFILQKLSTAGRALAPKIADEQLIRRIYFDLIGLPPTPLDIARFKSDPSTHRLEELINQLLASPQYGERWGRHWLDLVRYAETDGFEHDAVRPHSWRYRDYVIDSFNADKPYDQFIREQIAGDELWPGKPEALVATAFNLLGPDMVDSSDQVQRRHNTLNDMTDTTSLVFLGLTMGCARCHDHKFEPITQRDYFSMQAFFTSARFERETPIPSPAAKTAYEKALLELDSHPSMRALRELEHPIREKLREQKISRLPAEAQIAHRTPASQRNAEQSNLVLETQDKVAISEKEVQETLPGDQLEKWKSLVAETKKLPRPAPLPKTMSLAANRPEATYVLLRGDYANRGAQVGPAPPEVIPAKVASVSSRTALANWLAAPENPLTARVMVNRIWKQHFGSGLVATPSDFGTRGATPTHPELLDWLAAEFISCGWSIKAMHKLMLLSHTWQQSSAPHSDGFDPQNKLYSRMNKLRLEGEAIRDSLLFISGQLNPQRGGPGVYPPIPKELFQGASGWTPSKDPADHARRSIYIFARRNLRFPFLEVFDAPDSNLSCPTRERSTTAPQALTLLNADEVLSAARSTAARIRDDNSADHATAAYRLIFGRLPTIREHQIAIAYLEHSPLEEFCRALFNLNEFVYLE